MNPLTLKQNTDLDLMDFSDSMDVMHQHPSQFQYLDYAQQMSGAQQGAAGPGGNTLGSMPQQQSAQQLQSQQQPQHQQRQQSFHNNLADTGGIPPGGWMRRGMYVGKLVEAEADAVAKELGAILPKVEPSMHDTKQEVRSN